MILLKCSVGIIAVILTTLLGYKKSSVYKSNLYLWKELDKINSAMITNQLMDKESVISVLKTIDSEVSDEMSNRVKGQPFSEGFTTQLKEEYPTVEGYALSLGNGTSAEQLTVYGNFGTVIKEKMEKAKKDEEKYSSLCLKTGFLIGLMIFILII